MSISYIIPIGYAIIFFISMLTISIIFNKKNYINIIILVLIFLMNFRISLTDTVDRLTNNLNILFVVDNTVSMLANDYKDNITRLDAVKNDCLNIIDELNGSKFSLITFSNTSNIIIPFTSDTDAIKTAIDIMDTPNQMYAKGTGLNLPINSIEEVLSNTNQKTVIFFISDGEITDDSKLESYSKFKNNILNGAVLGYGTTEGSNIYYIDPRTDKGEYVEDPTSNNEKAISKLNEDNLKQIAKDLNIDYFNMNDGNILKNKLKEIKKSETIVKEKTKGVNYKDIYYIIAIIIFIILSYEFIIIIKTRRIS